MKLHAYSMHATEAVGDDIDSNVPTIFMEYTSWIKGEFPEKFSLSMETKFTVENFHGKLKRVNKKFKFVHEKLPKTRRFVFFM